MVSFHLTLCLTSIFWFLFLCLLIFSLHFFVHCAECGEILSTPTNISSPGYYNGGNYSNSEQCIWRIQNPQRTNTSIRIIIDHMALENHPRCGYDFLEIREGGTANSVMVMKVTIMNVLRASS